MWHALIVDIFLRLLVLVAHKCQAFVYLCETALVILLRREVFNRRLLNVRLLPKLLLSHTGPHRQLTRRVHHAERLIPRTRWLHFFLLAHDELMLKLQLFEVADLLVRWRRFIAAFRQLYV